MAESNLSITRNLIEQGTKPTSWGGHTINPKYGGQYGHFRRYGRIIDGKTYQEWLYSKPHVSVDVIPILLDYPHYLDFEDNAEERIIQFKIFYGEFSHLK